MEKIGHQGQAWSEEEERLLYDAFTAGEAVNTLATTHSRTTGAIRSHLRVLGLIDSVGCVVSPAPVFSASSSAQKRKKKATAQTARKVTRKSKSETIAPPPDINPRFKEALDKMETTQTCLFITGKAGTGKSTLLSYFCKITEKDPVILAPTGVAALNIKGQTIHSFFNFYVDVTPQKIREKKTKPRNAKLFKKLKMLIIDEISMVRADLLDCIDAMLCLYGPRPGRSFGGVQMIFIGDLYQLPPVVTAHEKELFATHYDTPYFFSAHVLRDFPLEHIELETVYRQKDERFVNLLNQIRNNTVTPIGLAELNKRHQPCASKDVLDGFAINLTTTNKRADEINEEHLGALNGKFYTSEADIAGSFTKDYYPTAPVLQFKIGAQIMMLNNDTAKRWVNGSIGVIRSLKLDAEKQEYLEVVLQGYDEPVEVYPHTWEVFHFNVEAETIVSEPVGTFTQFPFRLAWAITIHKSQGKTFDRIVIDIGRGTFAAGQMYVALSRCTALNGIQLNTPIARHHIRTDPQITGFLSAVHGEAEDDRKIGLIKASIRNKTALEIVYLKGDNTETTRTIHPLSLGKEQYKGHTFLGLRALCTLRQEERLFSVERILTLQPKRERVV